MGEARRRAMITIAVCWDGRDFYPVKYVNILLSMVKRNLQIPFEFVLLAGPEAEKRRGELSPEISIVPTGLPYWWGKLWMYKADLQGFSDIILYLDLDIVITGDLGVIAEIKSDFTGFKDYPAASCPAGREYDLNTSVVLMRRGARPEVWDEYVAAGMPTWEPFSKQRGRLPLAEMSIINSREKPVKHDLIPEKWVKSYKLHKMAQTGLPADCRIAVFHGRPKPHEVNDSWVKENWR